MILRRTFILSLALALSACLEDAPVEDPGEPPLAAWQNQTWQLASIDGATFSTDPAINATITFGADAYSFSAPCNGGNGTYTYGPYPTLTLGAGAMTIMECFGNVGAKEREFLAPLNDINRMRLVVDVFSLFTTDGTEMRFTPAP